jgi:hypothetical protein
MIAVPQAGLSNEKNMCPALAKHDPEIPTAPEVGSIVHTLKIPGFTPSQSHIFPVLDARFQTRTTCVGLARIYLPTL